MSEANKVYEMLRNFVDEQPLVGAVHEGLNPDSGNPMYFFLTDRPQYDQALEDAITDLELEIQNETGESIHIMRWPIPPSRANDYSFLGERIHPVTR